MEQLLLIESLIPTESRIISESTVDGKNLYLSGVFMQGGMQNRNGRVYPMNELTEAVSRAVSVIKDTNGIFGELDHPNTLTINLDRISHVITDLKMEGQNAIGKMRILCGPNGTPMGNIARSLIESGVRIGVSSRGRGSVDGSGQVSGFDLVTVDIVATPSAPGALPNSIYESLDSNRHGREAIKLAEAVCHDPIAQEYLKREILSFLNTNVFKKV